VLPATIAQVWRLMQGVCGSCNSLHPSRPATSPSQHFLVDLSPNAAHTGLDERSYAHPIGR
jgi:hypothetical protein